MPLVQPPAFLIYLCGHLRSFPLISVRQRLQWDAMANGSSYLVFLHTFDEIEHQRTVWWRPEGPPGSRLATALQAVNVSEILEDPQTNALHERMAARHISRHPRLLAAVTRQNLSDNRCCCKLSCVNDVAIQLAELSRVHRLATRFLHARGLSSHLGSLPVIRSRPDVTLRTDVYDGHTPSHATWKDLEPIQQLERLMHERESGAIGGSGGVVLGYRGPWWGGWGDIVWAARWSTVTLIVERVKRLGALLAMPPAPVTTLTFLSARVTESLTSAYHSRTYRAELVWMHYLRALGLRPFFWRFCNVARFRLGVEPGRTRHGLVLKDVALHMCH